MPSTSTLREGDSVFVTVDGKEYLMRVSWVVPAMSAGRAARHGPAVTASLRPGGWSVTFDNSTTWLAWRPAPATATNS